MLPVRSVEGSAPATGDLSPADGAALSGVSVARRGHRPLQRYQGEFSYTQRTATGLAYERSWTMCTARSVVVNEQTLGQKRDSVARGSVH